jgi:hypothetical protein
LSSVLQETPERLMSASWPQNARTNEVLPENFDLRCRS